MGDRPLHTVVSPENQEPSRDPFELFAAILLRRPLEPLEPDTSALVGWARAESSRWVSAGRASVETENVLAYRFLYAALRDSATTSARPIADPRAPRWERVLLAMCGLRHRQRAALALRHCVALSSAQTAEVLGVSAGEARRVIEGAIAGVARIVAEPVDVGRSLRVAASGARMPGSRSTAAGNVGRMPRAVMRNWVGSGLTPQPEPTPAATSAVERMLQRAEDEPPDILPAPPDPAGFPRVLRVTARHRSRRHGPALAAALVLTILAVLMPASAGDRERGTGAPATVLGEQVVRATPEPAAMVARTVVVEPGDTLWSISATRLGDPFAWRAVWRANRGVVMGPGARFDDPDLIQPGWRLRLPRLRGGGSSAG